MLFPFHRDFQFPVCRAFERLTVAFRSIGFALSFLVHFILFRSEVVWELAEVLVERKPRT
jgi:hypothetical protein